MQTVEQTIVVKGAGEMASAIAWRLFMANLKKILMLEIDQPLAVRREVSFSEAIRHHQKTVEGVEGVRAGSFSQIQEIWKTGKIAVMIDPEWKSPVQLKPEVLIDAILAKENLGTKITDAPRVIALGPGFDAGQNAHFVIETNRGHNLGRILTQGQAEPNTGNPTEISGIGKERVLRAPIKGLWSTQKQIGDLAVPGEILGSVDRAEVPAQIKGIIRGLLPNGLQVTKGLKIGDIDPRAIRDYCYTISDKARAISGAVLEAVLR